MHSNSLIILHEVSYVMGISVEPAVANSRDGSFQMLFSSNIYNISAPPSALKLFNCKIYYAENSQTPKLYQRYAGTQIKTIN